MPIEAQNSTKKSGLQVILDGKRLTVPPQAASSFRELFSYLEQMAIQGQRVLSSVCVDGIEVRSPGLKAAWEPFQQVEANTISFQDLGHHVVSVAREQVGNLLSRVEAVHMVVLINDWPVAQRLWWELVPDFKTPMLELSFLQELWGDRLRDFRVGTQSLAEHWDQIGQIQAELELTLQRRNDLVEFSDLLERRLLPWLRDLHCALGKLNEETLARPI